MFRWRGGQPPQNPILIVDIDERSLAKFGQWPWPRSQVAEIINRLRSFDVKVIGLDIMFLEPDRTSPKAFSRRYPNLAGGFDSLVMTQDPDRQLGSALANTDSVLGYVMLTQNDGLKKPAEVPFPSANLQLATDGIRFEQLNLHRAYRAMLNISDVAQGLSEGFLNFYPEPSGGVQKTPLLISLNDIPYPSMPLEVARIALAEPTLKIHVAEQEQRARSDLLGVSIGDHFIPTDENGQMSINYRGPWRTFQYISVVDLFEKDRFPELQGAIVLLGTSAAGLLDLQTTPFSRIFPGVEIHANIIDNLLAADPLRHDIFTEIGITIFLIIAGGVLFSLLLARSGALLGALGVLIVIGLAVIGNYLLLFRNGEIVGLTYPLITIVIICLVVTLSNYLLVERQRQFVQRAFKHYLAPQVVEELLANPEQLSLAGEEKILTVMFVDIRNFTSISEGMDSVTLATFINRYLTEMTRLITEGRGLLDKYIGDSIMAIWGAPLEDKHHAEHAIEIAMRMNEKTAQLRQLWSAEGLPEIHIGIGLNSGPMRVGNFGSEQLFDYTVIGDQVNLASRLEGLTKVYDCQILLSEQTYEQIKRKVLCRPIDLVRVKGKQQPVEIFEPLRVGVTTDPEIEQWQQALKLYQHQQFSEAGKLLAVLNRKSPQRLYKLYLSRIEQYLEQPPSPDWDGCFDHQEK